MYTTNSCAIKYKEYDLKYTNTSFPVHKNFKKNIVKHSLNNSKQNVINTYHLILPRFTGSLLGLIAFIH